MSDLWDKNLSIIFIIQLVFMLSFISFLFFIPVLLLSVIIQWKFSDKLAFMINFIFLNYMDILFLFCGLSLMNPRLNISLLLFH